MLTALGYVVDAWILGTYWLLARTGRARPFHLANALGCLPVIALELHEGAGVPLVLTAAFGALGWAGLVSRR